MAPTKYTPLTLHFSDAVTNVYPKQVEKLIANDGTYEYYRPLAENEQKDILWRTKTAKGLVDKYNKNTKGWTKSTPGIFWRSRIPWSLVSLREMG